MVEYIAHKYTVYGASFGTQYMFMSLYGIQMASECHLMLTVKCLYFIANHLTTATYILVWIHKAFTAIYQAGYS